MTDPAAAPEIPPFLNGGGEAGEMIRLFDWSATPLGNIEHWPQPLRTLVGVMLGSNQPMFIAWGEQRTLLYNDGYAAILASKHPQAMGRDFLDVWAEIRADLLPIVEQAYAGEPVHMADIELLLERKGYREETHFAFSYTPVRDEAGNVQGFFCPCLEITEQVLAERRMAEERERHRHSLQQMPGFAGVLSGPEHRYEYVNDAYRELVPGREFIGRTVREVFPEVADQGFFELLDQVYATGNAFVATAAPVSLDRQDGERFVDLIFEPIRDDAGEVTGIFVGGYDITDRVRAEQSLRESEVRLELATSAADLGIWDWDLRNGSFVYSAKAREISGLPLEGEVTLDMVRAATHPDDLPHTSAQAQRAIDPATKSQDPYEYRILLPNGQTRWVIAHGKAQFETVDGVEQAVRYVGTLQDISERRASEQEHVELAQRLKLALDASRMAVWELDVPSDTLVGSPDLNRLFGFPDDADPDLPTLRSCYYPGEQERLAEEGKQVFERGERYIEAEFKIIRPDGEVRWLGLRCEVLMSDEGQPSRVVGVLWDVSDQKAAEQRHAVLSELTSRIREIEDPEETSYIAAEVLGRALGVSRAGYGTIDLAAETITIARDWNAPGIKTLAGTLHFRDYGSYIEDLQRGEPVVFADAEKDPRTAESAEALKAISAQAVVNLPIREQHDVVALLYLNHETARIWTADELALIREVAEHTRTAVERRRAERELRALTAELEQRVETALAERRVLAEIVESTDAFVQVVDPQFRWIAMNRAAANEFERVFGMRPTVGACMLDLLSELPEERAAVKAAWGRALAGESYTAIQEFGELDRRFYEMKFDILRNRDGEQIGAFQFVYDVTDRLNNERRLAQTEEALRQAQKMEAMGQLTGGVAHDFNNLLTPIVGGLDMLQRRITADERAQRIVAGALTSAERAQTLVQRLLAFARRQPLQPAAIEIAQLIDGMRDLIASTSGPQVNLAIELPDDLPAALGDANQLEMALLNLAVNARDAMPAGGTLTLSAAAVEIGRGEAEDLQEGRYVRIAVSDTGVGMDEATLRKAIEPFFSTKGIGRGTGLGLSMVHGLAAQLGGALRLHSRLGAGTTITLFLPQAESRPMKLSLAPEPALQQGAGTALLADDEELVRASTAEMLRELGYDVVEAKSADEALQRLASGLSPDVVVTDHLMPGMTGAELARVMRREQPHVPVLVISGYANIDGIPREIPRLTKPFRRNDLARSLAALTGSHGG